MYIKDNFTFGTGPEIRSQYLEHWSSKGVIAIPLDAGASLSPYIPYVSSPVSIGDPHVKGNVHYPIHNNDFGEWAIRHQRGGDFIIYSDRKFVPIFPPFSFYL